MKFLKYITAIAVAAAAIACQQEETYAPGQADSLDCQGFYFPVQEAISTGELLLDSNDPTKLVLTAVRTNDYGEALVPYEVEVSEEELAKPPAVVLNKDERSNPYAVSYAVYRQLGIADEPAQAMAQETYDAVSGEMGQGFMMNNGTV